MASKLGGSLFCGIIFDLFQGTGQQIKAYGISVRKPGLQTYLRPERSFPSGEHGSMYSSVIPSDPAGNLRVTRWYDNP